MELKFEVTGMTCAACSARVEKVTKSVAGVKNAEVNLLAGRMTVLADSPDVAQKISWAVADAGYGAVLLGGMRQPKPDPGTERSLLGMKRRLILSAFFLIILMYFTMGHMVGLPVPHWYHGTENALVASLTQFFLTLPVVILNGGYFARGGKALWKRSPNMDSLIAVGSGSALIYGAAALFRMAYAMGHGDMQTVADYAGKLYFESAAMILTLVSLGKYLETVAKGRTGDAIRGLLKLRPETADVIRDGTEITVPADQVRVGEIVVVRSGGRIPADGTVVEGRASIDQSALTGESLPVEKAPGDTVAAATINTEGYLKFRADKVGEDTTLQQIIRMVEEAGGSKAPIARLADKIAGIFVPVVMGIALVTFLAWMLLGKGTEFALSMAISVLVISCPCALGLATPVAIMVGTGRGASLGVLFKNGVALENLHLVDTVVLDKTGTLTTGQPEVTDIRAQAVSEERLLALAASVESRSEHPFGKAVVKKYGDGRILPVSEFETIPGRGVAGTVEGRRVYGGNRALMEEKGISVPRFPDWSAEGKTPLYFAEEGGSYLGAIAASDVLKPDSAGAVAALKKLGLTVVMLTGDNQRTAQAIASAAGIDRVIADVLPADKAAAVQSLQAEGRRVLMVGDGINDAPALVTADVGMAIGAGTDIAIESADVVLMSGSLQGAANAVRLSRATIRNIKENLFWAFFYNCLGIPVAAGVLFIPFGIALSPMIGAAAMSFSSVFVVTNALRLRSFKPIDGAGKPRNMIQEEKDMETVIKVEGMMCNHCKARVEAVCKAVPGARDAVADLQAKTVTVTGDASVEALKKAITDAGYEVVG